MDLLWLTTFVNWLFMALALWLGLFVVTRSPRGLISWMAGLALASGSLYFAARVTYLHAVAPLASALAIKALNLGTSLFPAALLHIAVLLLPARMRSMMRFLIATAYVLAFIFVLLGIGLDLVLSPQDQVPRVYNSGKEPGPLYPFFILFILGTSFLSFSILYRLWRHERRSHLKPQLGLLSLATALVFPGGIYMGLSTWLRLNTPTLLGDTTLAASILLLGYAVSKWNALVEGRVIELDFVYTFLIIASMAGIYFLATGLLFGGKGLSIVNAVLITALAILTHFTYDWLRTFLDRFFYRRQFRELRANLRNFAREAGSGRSMERNLEIILRSLCRSFFTTKGFIALRDGKGLQIQESGTAIPVAKDYDRVALSTLRVRFLTPAERTGVLAEAAVLVPLLVRGEQIGALALGEKVAGATYTPEDFEHLEDLADQIAAIITTTRLLENGLRRIDEMVGEYRQREKEIQYGVQTLTAPEEEAVIRAPDGLEAGEFVDLAEEALRKSHDVSYLGQHPLADLRVVQNSLPRTGEPITHLDRGRALREVLLAAVDKLKPDQVEPKQPTREWYPFIVVHGAYILGEPNREIMSRLYISEGTFNRTRRRAILAVARALGEMERRQG